jgi:glycosyltransferase involved in cell wall biosynthesis
MISICILNWNCIDTIKNTIKIISKTNTKHEIIIFDQNSNDSSKEYLKSIDGSNNIRVILSETNCGNCIARNRMIEAASYEYVFLLDADIVPIKNSIDKMLDFMQKNLEFAYIGYDWKKFTNNILQITPEEKGIEKNEIKIQTHDDEMIAMTQYGLFRKSHLQQCPFPEFYPFDQEGWGAEDNIVGMCIIKNQLGHGGIINNRVYYHKAHTSVKLLGQDVFLEKYAKRVSAYLYFAHFLNPAEKIKALQNKTLPITEVNATKYFWKKHQNLGDVATDYIFQYLFPYIKFNNNLNNLFMFGGTIFDHIKNADIEYKTKFKNILMFGVGVSKRQEIINGLKQIENRNIKIFPRGNKSKQELLKVGMHCEATYGDVLQLFVGVPAIKHTESFTDLYIKDIYNPNIIEIPENGKAIRVANDNRSFLDCPYVNLKIFMRILKNYSKIHSSQIHPFFIAVVMGKPAILTAKDWRAEDLKIFKNLDFEMNKNQCDAFRLGIKSTKMNSMINSLFKELKILNDL